MQQCYILISLISPTTLPNCAIFPTLLLLSQLVTQVFSSNRPLKEMTHLRCSFKTQFFFPHYMGMETLTVNTLGRFGTSGHYKYDVNI